MQIKINYAKSAHQRTVISVLMAPTVNNAMKTTFLIRLTAHSAVLFWKTVLYVPMIVTVKGAAMDIT